MFEICRKLNCELAKLPAKVGFRSPRWRSSACSLCEVRRSLPVDAVDDTTCRNVSARNLISQLDGHALRIRHGPLKCLFRLSGRQNRISVHGSHLIFNIALENMLDAEVTALWGTGVRENQLSLPAAHLSERREKRRKTPR